MYLKFLKVRGLLFYLRIKLTNICTNVYNYETHVEQLRISNHCTY